MDFLFDPGLWAGLVTLVVLEIVLGIDNLVFIAILAKKLPSAEQDRALYMGLGLALVMRLFLLSVMSWLVGLTAPLFVAFGHAVSARDIILLAGGIFLLFKATLELHERLEARPHAESAGRKNVGFWLVIAQILILDAVFSLDSIITAVGMVDHLGVMMTAVVIAMIVMVAASKPLTRFVAQHPTVVVLCLSFLLMIGFSLVAEGLGFHIPKGYLYAAIGFSILIEAFNQIAHSNSVKQEARLPFRERTTMAIVRMMDPKGGEEREESPEASETERFAHEERHMVEGVLTLAERSIKTIMTPRSEIAWIDLTEDFETLKARLAKVPHSLLPVCEGSLEHIAGLVKTRDLVNGLESVEALRAIAMKRQPVVVPESISVMRLMRDLKRKRSSLVLVTDEFGIIQGLVTPHDVLEAIAGDFPDEGDTHAVRRVGDAFVVDGTAELLMVEHALGVDGLMDPDADYVTLAGLLLERFGHMPQAGEVHVEAGLKFTVAQAQPHKIETVKIERVAAQAAEA